jgi:hypothetical protein
LKTDESRIEPEDTAAANATDLGCEIEKENQLSPQQDTVPAPLEDAYWLNRIKKAGYLTWQWFEYHRVPKEYWPKWAVFNKYKWAHVTKHNKWFGATIRNSTRVDTIRSRAIEMAKKELDKRR